jgi:hypothetical protein
MQSARSWPWQLLELFDECIDYQALELELPAQPKPRITAAGKLAD